MLSRLVGSVSQALDFNAATLSGCIDIIVVPQDDGTLKSTPFHVRFGKARVLRSRDKLVDLWVNDRDTGIRMTLGAAGEAYFMNDSIIPRKPSVIKSEELPLFATTTKVNKDACNCTTMLDSEEVEHSHGQHRKHSKGMQFHDKLGTAPHKATKPIEIKKTNSNNTRINKNKSCKESVLYDELRSASDLSSTSEKGVDMIEELESVLQSTVTSPAAPPLVNIMPPTTTTLENEVPHGPLAGDVSVFKHPLEGMPFVVDLSFCGHILQGGIGETRNDNEVFDANIIKFSTMDRHPELWYHPSLVARFNKEAPFYPAKTAFPIVMSLVIFRQSLSPEAVFRLMNSTLTITPPEGALSHVLTAAGFGAMAQLVQHANPLDIKTPQWTDGSKDSMDIQYDTNIASMDEESFDPPPVVGCLHSCVRPAESEKELLDGEESKPVDKDYKTLRPTSRQLEHMELNWGENCIEFRLSGTSQCVQGTISLWEKDAKIVVSDVDGTITRSDVMGQLAPMVGKDWSHTAVTKLFTRVQRNGFHMLYLTARAIGQADITRAYLFGMADNFDTGSALPCGPLFLSPDRLFTSFKREVIDRTPYIFKIAALRDIRSLFPSSYNPFYAGFGNRDTDHQAYTQIGIPEGKVFIINSNGVVHHVNSAYATSYDSMADIAHQMFPHLREQSTLSGRFLPKNYMALMNEREGSTTHAEDEFIDCNYWYNPLPESFESESGYIASTKSKSEDEPHRRVRRLSSASNPDSRPVSRSLIGLRRRALRKKGVAKEEIFDVNKALDVTPFAELAQMYSLLDEFCPKDSQAQLLGLDQGIREDEEGVLERMIQEAIHSQGLRLGQGESLPGSETDEVQPELWGDDGIISKLEERLWEEMIELREEVLLDADDFDEVTSNILGIPYEKRETPGDIIDPSVLSLEPIEPMIESPSSYFSWRSR